MIASKLKLVAKFSFKELIWHREVLTKDENDGNRYHHVKFQSLRFQVLKVATIFLKRWFSPKTTVKKGKDNVALKSSAQLSNRRDL